MGRSNPRLERPPSVEALLRRRVIIGFILAVLLTGLMGFLSWRSTRLAAQEADLVAHTHAVMGTLDVTVEHAIELETSARGFALTGQDLLLTHYEAARGTINQDFGTLRHLTTDNPNQQRRLEVLEPQIAAALAFADELVAARRNVRAIPGASEIKQSERVVDAIRGTIQQMQAEETRLLNERSQKTGAARRLTTFVTVAGTLVGAVFILLAGFAVNREIGVSARMRAQVSALDTELEQRVEQRTAAVQSEIAARIATEQKLRASEELFRLLLDGIKDYAVYMLDPEGRVASWNVGAARIKGYSTEEILGIAHLVLLYSRGSGSRHACAHLTECNRHGPLRGTRITGPQRRLYLLGPRCDPPHLRRLGEAPRFLQSSARRHGAQTGGGSAA